jgi:hypothetical protein
MLIKKFLTTYVSNDTNEESEQPEDSHKTHKGTQKVGRCMPREWIEVINLYFCGFLCFLWLGDLDLGLAATRALAMLHPG